MDGMRKLIPELAAAGSFILIVFLATQVLAAPDTTPPVTSALPGGGTYIGEQYVYLEASEPGSTYYCLGADCVPGVLYTNSINIQTSTTLRFYSIDSAGNQEAVVQEVYNISADTTPPVTTATPPSGDYQGRQTISFLRNESGITYYCQGAGCTPSRVYTTPIELALSTRLRFHSIDAAGNAEEVKDELYQITPLTGDATIDGDNLILGNTILGSEIGYGNRHALVATRFVMPNHDGLAKHLAVYVDNPESGSNYGLAVYSGNNTEPDKLLFNSPIEIVDAAGWYEVSLDLDLSANQTYWLAYNTDASHPAYNVERITSGEPGQTVWRFIWFGTGFWPSDFGYRQGSSDNVASVYLSYEPIFTNGGTGTTTNQDDDDDEDDDGEGDGGGSGGGGDSEIEIGLNNAQGGGGEASFGLATTTEGESDYLRLLLLKVVGLQRQLIDILKVKISQGQEVSAAMFSQMAGLGALFLGGFSL
ncbi:MAG: hypothetical protein A2114_02115 [Candidatus Vogelbacteria bacterium GWA1_51_14]|uniref:GH29D-like beta-sandwich domain-containing protein n=1 Tax=Candidatus Vogelbacteria bacterium GWA1_51_14 TaxID=1802435 RepID=A0A1G2QBB9_9BACT|nr:MAG: hypothetical protein A2114_02115 [Candidatus Vogelbacteria bacterium GWA1_51_14]